MRYLGTAEREGITVVTLDRPPVNAMDLELLAELVAVFDRLAADVPPAVVLAGREGVFSAGVDLKAVPGYDADERRRMVEEINRMALGGYGLPCPVVCAVTGHAIAGGFVLALCGDHRVAAAEGRYGLTEIKVGVPYPRAAIGVVRAELTATAARALALGSRLVDADACVRLGAFDEAVPAVAVLDRAVVVAGELSRLPASVYWETKAQLRGVTLAALRAAASSDPLLDGWLAPEPATPAVRIRDAIPEEVAALEALQRRSSAVWEEYRAQLAAHPDAIALAVEAVRERRVRVAVDALDWPIGFSVVEPAGDELWELEGLFVEPSHMRRGVGRLLVDDAVERLPRRPGGRLDVIANPRAVGFYAALGFRHGPHMQTRFGPAHRMYLEL